MRRSGPAVTVVHEGRPATPLTLRVRFDRMQARQRQQIITGLKSITVWCGELDATEASGDDRTATGEDVTLCRQAKWQRCRCAETRRIWRRASNEVVLFSGPLTASRIAANRRARKAGVLYIRLMAVSETQETVVGPSALPSQRDVEVPDQQFPSVVLRLVSIHVLAVAMP